MAALLPVSPSIAAEKDAHVENWNQKFSDPESVHANTVSPPLTPGNCSPSKRKRVTACAPTRTMSARTASPKRMRHDSETERQPDHRIPATETPFDCEPARLLKGYLRMLEGCGYTRHKSCSRRLHKEGSWHAKT
ncbi:hypothetical protein EJ07DRAFT_153246 [Lizonia empirigonia]|nr:hypothetical protein EJ07DRAFT_153246 [Lizonia empirigonia]